MLDGQLDSAPEQLIGAQRPQVLWVPDSGVTTESGREAIELAAAAGLILDPWQQLVLEHALAEREDGRWAAFEVGLLVSRQNGKGSILEALELANLFLFGAQLILHTAHEFKTAQEAFLRICTLIDGKDEFRRRVKRIRTSHGDEGVEMRSGQRLRFLARSRGSGRGFSGDLVILDEAFNLPDAPVEALMPTMSARPNPQLWYTSSAADKNLAPCEPLARIRERGHRGDDPSLAFFEWTITPHTEFCKPGCTEHDDPGDVRSWAKANPGLGIRISVEHVAREYLSMSPEGFARERLGVGNWPTASSEWTVIAEETWTALIDPKSRPIDPVVFAPDITPDRSFGAIGVAGRREDGLVHVEVTDHRPGTAWIVPRLVELAARWKPAAVVIDGGGQAGSLIPALEAEGFEVVSATGKPSNPDSTPLVKLSSQQAAQACGAMYEGVVDAGTWRHLGQPMLAAALAGAQQRHLGGAWAWDRKDLSVDISPLVAVTNAAWGLLTRGHLVEEPPAPFFLI